MSTNYDISYGWYLKSSNGQRNIEVVYLAVYCITLLSMYGVW